MLLNNVNLPGFDVFSVNIEHVQYISWIYYCRLGISQSAFTYSKLTIETLEQFIVIVNFEHISHLCFSVFIVNFEHIIAGWNLFVCWILGS